MLAQPRGVIAVFGFGNKKVSPVFSEARVAEVPGHGTLRIMRSADCLGAVCPRPQLLAMKLLSEVGPGDVVELVTDNPTAVEGFAPLAEILVCTLLAVVKEAGVWRIYLRKSQ